MDGIYICFNGWHDVEADLEYDLIFQFYKNGEVGFGDIPHMLNPPEIRDFINKRVEKMKREGKTQQFIRNYYNQGWFFDMFEYSCKARNVEPIKFKYISGIYRIDNNNITISRENSTIQKKYFGIIKQDALDLHVTYSFTDAEDDDLYEFIAFDY